ncbi:MAG: glycosyltransferase family 39 protein [Acidimicrobiales bacterium]
MAVATVAAARARGLGKRGASLNWADAGMALLLVVVGVVAPLLLAARAHALGIPRNDDWSYRLVLFRFVRTGNYRLQGWGAMTLVGQVLWAAPFVVLFGPRPWVPGVAVAVISAMGIVAAYRLARYLLPRWWAAACVLCALAFPGFLLNTSSFMTDAPAFSAAVGCLVLGVAAAKRVGAKRWALLAGSLATGCFGFSVREFDLAAPAAVLVVMAFQDRRRLRLYVACAGALLAVCGAVLGWTAQLPGAQAVLGLAGGAGRTLSAAGTSGALATGGGLSPSPEPFWQVAVASLQSFAGSYFTLAFALAPLLALTAERLGRRVAGLAPGWYRDVHAPGTAAAAVVGVALLATNGSVFVGNYLAQQGATANEDLPGVRPALFPDAVWLCLGAVAVVAGTVLAAVLSHAAHELRRTRPWQAPGHPASGMLVVFSVLTGGGLAIYGVFLKGEMFDRYLWPLIFSMAVLFAQAHLKSAQRAKPRLWPRAVALVLAGVAATVACAITVNSDFFDAARWAAGEKLVAMGVPATKVDAGFEWVGYHFAGLAVHGREVKDEPSYDKSYEAVFPGFSACAIASSSPLSDQVLQLAGTVPYKELGFALTEHLYLYRVVSPACRAERW